MVFSFQGKDGIECTHPKPNDASYLHLLYIHKRAGYLNEHTTKTGELNCVTTPTWC